jgi:hypothetical protein
VFNFLFVSGTVVVICKANETLHFPLPPLRRLLTPSRRLFLCMLKIPVKFHFRDSEITNVPELRPDLGYIWLCRLNR